MISAYAGFNNIEIIGYHDEFEWKSVGPQGFFRTVKTRPKFQTGWWES